MKPRLWYRFALIAALILMSSACSRGPERTFSTEGNTVTITSPSHEVRAITRDGLSGSFLVVKTGTILHPESLSYIDATLSLIRIEEAQAAKQEVFELLADITSPPQEPRKIRPVVLKVIASGGPAFKKLSEIKDLTEKNLHPVVEMSLQGIRVMEVVHNGSPVYLTGDAGIQYILERIEIQEKNFR